MWPSSKRLKIFLLILFAAAAGAFLFKDKIKPSHPAQQAKGKYNILVLSVCSLRWDMIGFDQEGNAKTPHLSAFARRSTIFKNAFSSVSWSNVSGFFSRLKASELSEWGYTAVGSPWIEDEIRQQNILPGTPTYYSRSPEAEAIPQDAFIRDKQDLKKRVLEKKNWPFFVEYHLKMMHYPYAPPPRKNTIPNDISAADLQYVAKSRQKLISNPKKYAANIFLITMLTPPKEIDQEVISKLPISLSKDFISPKTPPTYAGLLNNKHLLEIWRKSKNYKKDVAIIKKFYASKLQQLDAYIGEILLGFGDRELLENTVIIFTGDHGEAFGEHGLMIHGETVYDEVLRTPLAISFPGQKNSHIIDRQFYQGSLMDIVKAIMAGKLSHENFLEYAAASTESKFLLARNCSGNLFSVRKENAWKLIIDFLNNEKKLFNIKDDPKEQVNVIDEHPDIAGELEELWQLNYSKWVFGGMMLECK